MPSPSHFRGKKENWRSQSYKHSDHHSRADVIRIRFAFSIDTKRANDTHGGALGGMTINWCAPRGQLPPCRARVCPRRRRRTLFCAVVLMICSLINCREWCASLVNKSITYNDYCYEVCRDEKFTGSFWHRDMIPWHICNSDFSFQLYISCYTYLYTYNVFNYFSHINFIRSDKMQESIKIELLYFYLSFIFYERSISWKFAL